jgi:hypothetical protein
MACVVRLEFDDGRTFTLGRFNQGKKTPEQIALTAAKKYRNLIKRLGCGDSRIVIADGNVSVPINAIQQDL